ncbi:hypothetical protein [Sphingomonas sp. IW22]|uniref:hypothetical protein n=1 Tax=Sphingomonas sp. IW22 TaxID=3242489 RepID=UPI0035221EDB
MNTNKAEKLWATAMHPSTNDNEASNAFIMLRRALSSSGGIETYMNTKFSAKGGRPDSEWADMYFRLTKRFESSQREHAAQINEIEGQHKAAMARAQRRVADVESALEAKEVELAEAQARGGDDLGVIDQRNAEIRGLIERLKEAKKALTDAEEGREQYVAERVAAVEQEIKKRVLASLGEEAAKPQPEPDPQPTRRRRAQTSAKTAASAPKRARARANKGKARGANNENLVLDLLTNEWKSTSTLFNEAKRYGFSGVENAIRFAAQRLVEAGNAVQGRDTQGRIAFRRA